MDEIWKDIPGYESLYQVSDQGRFRCIARYDGKGARKQPTTYHPGCLSNGYLQVSLTKGKHRSKKYIHQLVMLAFVGEIPDGQQVNHKNGVKTDNHLVNLEYVTSSENHHHAYDVLGKVAAQGEHQGGSKLTAADVEKIRSMDASGKMGCRRLARMFGVSPSTIRKIVLRKSWNSI